MCGVATSLPEPAAGKRIPRWVAALYSGFLCVLTPLYWHDYGPTNFLYFCDVALFLALASLWQQRALWASMAAVGIVLPQTLWILDFLGGLVGLPLTGMTAYMSSPAIPLFTRALSLFHFWLPLLLLWIVWRLGYDRRALVAWTLLAWLLILVCFFLMPPPPAPADNPNLPVNINYVHGLNDQQPQQWMHPLAYLGLLAVGLPLGVYLPTHLLLKRFFPPAHDR